MKIFVCTLCLFLSYFSVCAQDSTWDRVTRPSLFIHFSSLVFKGNNSASGSGFSNHYSGIGGSYVQGLAKQLDLAISLYGFQVYYPFRTTLNYRSKNGLYELDASVKYKILPNKHLLNPFLTGGIGAYYYVDTYGSFVPLGGGLQASFHDKFYAALSYQYRIPINEQTQYHSIYSLSAGIPLTSRKKKTLSSSSVASVNTPRPPVKKLKDADNDGVADVDDACPNVAGVVANKGCPDVSNNLVTGKQVALYRIYFFTDQTTLPDATSGILQTVLTTLKGNSKLKLQLNGNTDNQEFAGQTQSNSLLRALSIANFFLNNGIDQKRIMALGLGDTNPKSTNETLTGRSENRRVEINVVRD